MWIHSNLPYIMPVYISYIIADYWDDNYDMDLIKINEGLNCGRNWTDYIGLCMYYVIPLDWQVFVPMDEEDYERMDKSHTFNEARMTTNEWIRKKLEWRKKYK